MVDNVIRSETEMLPRNVERIRRLRMDFQRTSLEDSQRVMAKWPEYGNHTGVNCLVHGSIEVPQPIKTIVDTHAFQRLRKLKQTGIVNLVYPSCNHTRFDHSLGVFHLANCLVQHIRSREPHLNVTSEDHLCVCIAALLHDVGHGPFSHLFDGLFAERNKKSWKHEDMSMRIVDKLLLEDQRVREELEKYLSTGEVYERNVMFIKELIGSKRFKSDIEDTVYNPDWSLQQRKAESEKNWAMRGRSMDKSFLYDIVSNESTGHDVDKMDYLLRDSKLSGVPIALSLESIKRLLNNIRVVTDSNTGCLRIGYSQKVHNDIKLIGDSRWELHDKVYQHKAVRGMELLLVDAMVLASEALVYKGSDGRDYNLSNVMTNVEAFLNTSDFIIDEIMRLDATRDEKVAQAQEFLRRLEKRDTFKKMGFVEMSPKKLEIIQNDLNVNKKDITKSVEDKINEKTGNTFKDRFVVMIRDLGRGIDNDTHPIQREVFFDSKEAKPGEIPIGIRMEKTYVEYNCSQTVTKWELFIMGNREISSEDQKTIVGAMSKVIDELGLIETRKRPHGVDDNRNIATAHVRRRIV